MNRPLQRPYGQSFPRWLINVSLILMFVAALCIAYFLVLLILSWIGHIPTGPTLPR